jgi:hypothetical protein
MLPMKPSQRSHGLSIRSPQAVTAPHPARASGARHSLFAKDGARELLPRQISEQTRRHRELR